MTMIFMGLGVAFIIYWALGWRTVRQQERWVIERLGRFLRIWQPGFRHLWPVIDQVRKPVVDIREFKIDLFVGNRAVFVDMKDGSAKPIGAEVWVRILNPDTDYAHPPGPQGQGGNGTYRSVYFIARPKEAIRDLLETAMRTYLNGLTIDEALVRGRAGYDFRNHFPQVELDKMNGTLARWGFEMTLLTMEDLQLTDELISARGDVQKRKRAVEVARHERKVRAIQTLGAYVQMRKEATGMSEKEIKKLIREDEKEKEALRTFVENIVTRQMSIDGRALQDIRLDVGGAAGLLAEIIRLARGGQNGAS